MVRNVRVVSTGGTAIDSLFCLLLFSVEELEHFVVILLLKGVQLVCPLNRALNVTGIILVHGLHLNILRLPRSAYILIVIYCKLRQFLIVGLRK